MEPVVCPPGTLLLPTTPRDSPTYDSSLWAAMLYALLGLSLAAPCNTEVISCNDHTLNMFWQADGQLGLPVGCLRNAWLAAESPTLLAMCNEVDGTLHGLWAAEQGIYDSHAGADKVKTLLDHVQHGTAPSLRL